MTLYQQLKMSKLTFKFPALLDFVTIAFKMLTIFRISAYPGCGKGSNPDML